jgi:AraC family transcriptional regulator
LRISKKTQPATTSAYLERVNRAIDHIVGHLAEPLRLRDLAGVALLSPFHFHRVFQALVGSTPADFVRRLRLEKALTLMALPRAPSLTTIALGCGFSSSSDFSRCFRRRFGVPPSAFDLRAWRQAHGEELEALVEQAAPLARIDRLPPRNNPDSFRVKVRDLPARTVAYIRVDRPYQGNGVIKACRRLVSWAERNGLADGQWLGYQWDNPEITSLEDCRYYVAVEAKPFTPPGRGGPVRISSDGGSSSRHTRGDRSRAARLAMALRLLAATEWICSR